MSRIEDLRRFYEILALLGRRLGGTRMLKDCDGWRDWPSRGVYFFFESGEVRSDSGTGARVVRVGTHAITEKSRTTLWNRLSQHRGLAKTGGGNHRGSIFRLIVGTAIKSQLNLNVPTWGVGNSASREVRAAEQPLEQLVSQKIGEMPFLWLEVNDAPSPKSQRGVIEQNSIALLSNHLRTSLDAPSEGWLGRFCDRERVRKSGLWNQNHVDQSYDPKFLGLLGELVEGRKVAV